MKSPLPPAAALVLAAVCLTGCRKEDTATAPEIVRQAPPALPPAEWTPAPSSDADFLTPSSPAVDSPVPEQSAEERAAFEAWFQKHHLDLNDPAMLDADADGDGVSNRDEFLADTDPHNDQSRPGLHRLIRLKEYSEVRLPIVLEAVEGGKARIRRTEQGESRIETVRSGETIKGLPLKVGRIESRRETDKSGQPIDLSRVDLEDANTKEKLSLVKDLPTKTSASFAVLTSPDGKTTLKVHQGDVFTWPGESGATYEVIDMSRDQVVLRQVENKKMWTIPRM